MPYRVEIFIAQKSITNKEAKMNIEWIFIYYESSSNETVFDIVAMNITLFRLNLT